MKERLPARVHMILPNGSSEEPFAAVAGCGAVVLSRGAVAAYGTKLRENIIDSCIRKTQDGNARRSYAHT